MTNQLLEEHAVEYARLSGIQLNLKTPLGHGQDGRVWKSNRNTAVKALEREANYSREVTCYKRFRSSGITSLQGFAVPQLIDYNDDLLIIEMGIVTAPFILDFAKSWIDGPADYTAEVLEDWENTGIENFGAERWSEVRSLLYSLRRFGIYYYDAKPANIMFPPG